MQATIPKISLKLKVLQIEFCHWKCMVNGHACAQTSKLFLWTPHPRTLLMLMLAIISPLLHETDWMEGDLSRI